MVINKPSSLEKEHEEIHNKLKAIVDSSGKTATAAKKVAELLHLHFEKEEELAMPPLGALQPYVEGKLKTSDKEQIVRLTKVLKKEYKQMLKEHTNIVNALGRLAKAATEENRKDALGFVDSLKNHAINEEELLYPAALVLGELLQKKQ